MLSSFTISWLTLTIGLLLLLPPTAAFHGRHVRYRHVIRRWDGYWGRTLSLGMHSIDLLRAALGAWLLRDALQSTDARWYVRYIPDAIEGGVLLAATAIQTLYCKERDAANAPLTFVTGLALGFVPPVASGFAVLLAVVLAVGARKAAAYFPLLALSTLAVVALFTGKKERLPDELVAVVVLAAAVALPWLLTMLFPRPLVVSYVAKRAEAGSVFAVPKR